MWIPTRQKKNFVIKQKCLLNIIASLHNGQLVGSHTSGISVSAGLSLNLTEVLPFGSAPFHHLIHISFMQCYCANLLSCDFQKSVEDTNNNMFNHDIFVYLSESRFFLLFPSQFPDNVKRIIDNSVCVLFLSKEIFKCCNRSQDLNLITTLPVLVCNHGLVFCVVLPF